MKIDNKKPRKIFQSLTYRKKVKDMIEYYKIFSENNRVKKDIKKAIFYFCDPFTVHNVQND